MCSRMRGATATPNCTAARAGTGILYEVPFLKGGKGTGPCSLEEAREARA